MTTLAYLREITRAFGTITASAAWRCEQRESSSLCKASALSYCASHYITHDLYILPVEVAANLHNFSASFVALLSRCQNPHD